MSMHGRNLRRILALVPLILKKTEMIASPSSLAYAGPTSSPTRCKSNLRRRACSARFRRGAAQRGAILARELAEARLIEMSSLHQKTRADFYLPLAPQEVRRYYVSFAYRAQSWNKPRCVQMLAGSP
jgi:hypothetical protein